MKKIILVLVIITSGISLSSCLKGSTNSCSFDACAFKASAQEIRTINDYLTNNSLIGTQHCSGMFYRVENPGTGAAPGPCSNVAVTYKAYLFNGTVFDQSATPVALSLSQTITGWRSGVPLVKAGGRIVLYVPPSLGYGNQDVKDQNGNVVIPANSYLVFEVDVISVS